jgi:hypothetical protein
VDLLHKPRPLKNRRSNDSSCKFLEHTRFSAHLSESKWSSELMSNAKYIGRPIRRQKLTAVLDLAPNQPVPPRASSRLCINFNCSIQSGRFSVGRYRGRSCKPDGNQSSCILTCSIEVRQAEDGMWAEGAGKSGNLPGLVKHLQQLLQTSKLAAGRTGDDLENAPLQCGRSRLGTQQVS